MGVSAVVEGQAQKGRVLEGTNSVQKLGPRTQRARGLGKWQLEKKTSLLRKYLGKACIELAKKFTGVFP